jgi:hypothetical protein
VSRFTGMHPRLPQLVPLAEQASLCPPLTTVPRHGFCRSRRASDAGCDSRAVGLEAGEERIDRGSRYDDSATEAN